MATLAPSAFSSHCTAKALERSSYTCCSARHSQKRSPSPSAITARSEPRGKSSLRRPPPPPPGTARSFILVATRRRRSPSHSCQNQFSLCLLLVLFCVSGGEIEMRLRQLLSPTNDKRRSTHTERDRERDVPALFRRSHGRTSLDIIWDINIICDNRRHFGVERFGSAEKTFNNFGLNLEL